MTGQQEGERSMTATAGLRTRLDALPRVRLAHLPTPLDSCPRLSAELGGGRRISVKRDDCTGLAFGGNKVRQHEYILADAIAAGADCIIQGAAAQSNHSRQLAAAGAKLGLDVYLVPKLDAHSFPVQGNFLVDHLLGATIVPIRAEESVIARKAKLADELREQGRNPYVVGMGAERSLALAAVAYVGALCEIVEAGPAPDFIYTTSQGSTQAGLRLGCELLGLATRVVGVTPMRSDHEAYLAPEQVAELARGAAELLGVTTALTAADMEMTEDFVGDGYGIPTPAGIAALRRLASTEGILLDPVYTGKGFSGLLEHCRTGQVPEGASAVFVHTGGLPAIFSYAAELTAEG
jgi:1-aminocyclopropane-1-carboxylate deaminase/D-cysteine desulfhydrase-like pyridoxal-dependent ACC family enzyme